MTEPAPLELRSRDVCLLIALVAFGFMLYEVALLREIRAQLTGMWVSDVFFTSVLVLIGLGAIAVSRFQGDPVRLLRDALLGVALLSYVSFAATVIVAQLASPELGDGFTGMFGDKALAWDGWGLARAFLLSCVLGYGVMFVLHGILFTVVMGLARRGGFVSHAFGADLGAAGGGAACAAAVSWVLDPGQMVGVATLAFVAAVFLLQTPLGIGRRRAFAVCAIGLLGAAIPLLTDEHHELETREEWDGYSLLSAWSPYQRVDAFEAQGEIKLFVDNYLYYSVPNPATGFLASPIDTVLHEVLLSEMTRPSPRLLIVGSGFGRDVVALRASEQAAGAPATDVTTIELDGAVVELAKRVPWVWRAYGSADVTVGEGRYFLETTERTFDVIHYAYLDQNARIASVLLADALFLYTAQALEQARERLEPGGYFLAKRVIPDGLHEHVAQQAVATATQAGIPRGAGLVAVSQDVFHVPGQAFRTMFLLFTQGEEIPAKHLEILTARFERVGIDVLPWDAQGTRPTTDIYPLSITDGKTLSQRASDWASGHPLLAGLAALGLALLAWGLSRSVAYAQFFVIGLAFMLVEAAILAQSFLLLGNPSLSTGVALGVFLVGVGLGGWWSERLQTTPRLLAAVPLVVLGVCVLLPLMLPVLLSSGVAVRVLVFVLTVFPLSVCAGTMFPISLRVFTERSVPLLLFVNVLGNAGAPFCFRLSFGSWGYPPVALGCGALYALGALILYRRLRAGKPAAA